MPRNPRGPHVPAGSPIGGIGARILRAWGLLDPDRRLAGGAAGLLLISMFMPWYQQNAVLAGGRAADPGAALVSRNLSAFAVFSFIEAFVLIAALGTLLLLFVRAERRGPRLPTGDGTVILVAGGWTGLLLVYRLFDKPGISTHGVAANMGIQWGIFFALLAAGLLVYSGSRIRSPARARTTGPAWSTFRTGHRHGDVDAEIPPDPRPHPAEHEPTVLLARPRRPGRDTRRGILPPREIDATVRFSHSEPATAAGRATSEEETAVIADDEETAVIGGEDETAVIGAEEPTVNRQLSFEDPDGESSEGPGGPHTAAGRRARP